MLSQPPKRFGPEDLRRVLASTEFARSERMARFLTYLYEHGNHPEGHKLKETEIGSAVFDRPVGYDPKLDSIVRVEATRLRKKLAAYYAGDGAADPVKLILPVGRYELDFVETPAEPVVPPPAEKPVAAQPPRRRMWFVGAACLLLAAIASYSALTRQKRVEVLETAPLTALPGAEDAAALSPDGKRIAFVWDGESKGTDFIYLGGWASARPARLTDGKSAEGNPVWSADGNEIAYLRQAGDSTLEVRIRRLADGADEAIAQMQFSGPEWPGLSMSPDGQWLATAEAGGGFHGYRLIVISRATRQKRFFHPVTGIPASRRSPVFSPDGKQIAFVESAETATADVWVAAFPEGPERRVTNDHRPVHGLAWAPDGTSLIVASYRERNQCGLWRMPLAGNGKPVRLTEPGVQAWSPVVSRSGRMVFSKHVDNINLWRGTPGELWIASTGLNSTPRFSNDGKRLAFRSNRSGRSEIWVLDQPDGSPRRLTFFEGPVTGSPRWSPDDKWIAFDSRRFGRADIFVVAAQGGEPKRVTEAESNEVVPCWSPDGRFVYYASDREGGWAVWRKALAGGAEELVRRKAFSPFLAADGALYYTHGPNEVGLFRASGAGAGPEETVLPDLQSGMWGNWALTGAGIFYLSGLPNGSAELRRIGSDGKTVALAAIPHPVRWDGGLGVSSDGSAVSFASVDRSDSDLYWTDALR